MTPDERQRTMDFILRSQADSVVRMDRMEMSFQVHNEQLQAHGKQLQAQAERFQAQDVRLQSEIDDLKSDVAALVSASQDLSTVSRTLLESDCQAKKRLDRLEGSGH